MVVTPKLNTLDPTTFIPVDAELPVVAPVITHVSLETLQLSLYAGSGTATGALQFVLVIVCVMFAGQLTAGFWLSVTVTVCVQVFVLPLTSVTVHTTLVVPTGNCAGALLVTDATPQLSLTVGLPKFTFEA